jgi:hypothetical protein
MKRVLSAFFLLALALSLTAQEIKVETRVMEQTETGNHRFPNVATNFLGEILYTFRGKDAYSHYYFYKNGTWKGGERIPGSPQYEDYWFSDIVVDSTGTFHYVAEDADDAMYYGYFKEGTWAPMRLIDIKHEATLGLGVRSDDTVVLTAPRVGPATKGVTKDVIIGTKAADETEFSSFKNITNDQESSTMVDLAVDANDNSWVIYKGAFFEPGGGENMQAVLLVLDQSHKEIYWKNVSDQGHVYCWYPSIAISGEGKVMVTWYVSQLHLYFSRLYDPATEKWTEVQQIMGGPAKPWPTMYNKIIARESDFYWVGVDPERYVRLYKYNAESNSWSRFVDISDRAANWCSAWMADDSILVAWDSMKEPTVCYLTTVSGEFLPPVIRIQSVSNLKWEKKVESSFFHAYYMNILTWEANPLNIEQEITIASQRIYRRATTAGTDAWVKIAEVAGNVYDYLDRDVTADSDFVYAVTCVDTNGAESPLVDPTEEGTGTAQLPRPASIKVIQ